MSFKKPSYEKPIINMKKYKDFRVRISQVPPMDVAFQSMAMGEYELLVATIYRLNNLIEVTNNYTEKIDEVLEWLLNEGLELAVYEQLVIWKEDGTLDNLINDLLFRSKLDKVEFEEFKLEYEEFKNQTNQDINNLLNSFGVEISRIDGELEDLDNDIQEVTTQLTQTETLLNDKTSSYVTPEQFGYDHENPDDESIQEWLDYARDKDIIARASNLTINRDFNFRSVKLEITGGVNIKNNKITFGGNSQHGNNRSQYINLIVQDDPNEHLVFVRGAKGMVLTINYSTHVIFRLSENVTETSIAYSQFNFKYVNNVIIENDPGNTGSLWFNENEFHLLRSNVFKMSGTYPHNNNRIYGGTFEGSYALIELNIGRNNTFYDMRFEGTPTVRFGENTNSNVVYQSWKSSYPNDKVNAEQGGWGNKVIAPHFDFSKKIIEQTVNALNVSDYSNFNFNVSENYLTTSGGLSVVFDSGFIPFKSGYALSAQMNGVVQGGIRVRYYLYDANFDEITTSASAVQLQGVGPLGTGVSRPSVNTWGNLNLFTSIDLENVSYIKIQVVTATPTTCVGFEVSLKDLNRSI